MLLLLLQPMVMVFRKYAETLLFPSKEDLCPFKAVTSLNIALVGSVRASLGGYPCVLEGSWFPDSFNMGSRHITPGCQWGTE